MAVTCATSRSRRTCTTGHGPAPALARDNTTFEGLALTPDARIAWVAMEAALQQDGPVPGVGRPGGPCRFTAFDVASGRAVRQIAYMPDAVQHAPTLPGGFSDNGVSEILMIDADRMLVLERGYSMGVGIALRLYAIDTRQASDTLALDPLAAGPIPARAQSTGRRLRASRALAPGHHPGHVLGTAPAQRPSLAGGGERRQFQRAAGHAIRRLRLPGNDMNDSNSRIAFIGGGNMASAIIGGLLQQGLAPAQVAVVEPFGEARARLRQQFGIAAREQPDAALADAGLVVWAVKPQTFKEAAAQARAHVQQALQLSVAAGIRSDSIAAWLGTERIVRAMPNTPALVGKGMTALYARGAADGGDRQRVEQVIATTGEFLWVEEERQLDAVTALSGSGPAYVFYFLEAMEQAGAEMGLSQEQARRLAVATFAGASELARASSEPLQLLRERVTSKGGTTYAALTSLQGDGVQAAFVKALHAACDRAGELGDEFGK